MQSEALLENNLIKQLIGLGYQSVLIHDGDVLLANLKSQLEAFNKTTFTAKEFGAILNHLAKGNVFALADTIYAVGALSAGFFINKLFDKASIVKVIVILTFLVAFIFIAAAISKSILVIYIVSIILGFCNAGIRVLRLTYMFKIIPNNLMGRVGSIFNLINVLTRSIFIFMFSQSFFSISNNIIFAYVIMAIFLLIAGAILLFSKNKLATI